MDLGSGIRVDLGESEWIWVDLGEGGCIYLDLIWAGLFASGWICVDLNGY